MIKSFKHKQLKYFYLQGKASGVQTTHIAKLRNILVRLAVCSNPQQMNLPGLDLHPLKGNLKGYYSLKVNGNWRLIFRFDGQDVYDIDYLDYH